MDLRNKFINLVAPPAALFFLCLVLPPLYFLKLFFSLFSALFPQNLRQKVVLITGASSGIGENLAYQYAKKGASLALVARREGRLRETANRSRELGSPDVLVIQADVSNPDDCRRFIETTVSHFGRLDHLVNNAGISCVCLFEEVSNITSFSQVMDINFWGLIYPTHFAIPQLKKSRGRIVVTSSAASWLPMPRMSFYNASKAALTSFYETLRVELGREVGVTIATPGLTESEMTQGKMLTKEGHLQMDQETTDRYLTVPAWFRAVHVCRMVAPEVVDWFFRLLFMARPGGEKEPLSKKLFDATGAKEMLYPSSQQSSEIKQD
ncbi:unnamed protein product [Spirodela intermedia]|uniref:Uncharacterized protein n=1 Tax=Spirodela intermedia TaxID=51605 RepID=A0A7I8JE02_SPIIN|nr:unnamed protein product [Spirodela intermedia]CAA6668347.1 unnamed protein product [Spirodela intermedia]